MASEASLIARRHALGGGVASRMDHRATAPLRNHSRDNILAMRKKERQIRGQSVIESLKQPQREFKLRQFDNVKSRLFQLPPPMLNGQPTRAEYMERRCSSERPASRQKDENGDRPSSPREAEHGSEAGSDAGGDMDLASFERECERLKQMHGKKEGLPPRQFRKNASGCPAYIQKIKAERAEQQRQAEASRAGPRIPPGYREMPEEERTETLQALRNKREELEKAFQRLPFNIETDSQRRRQEQVLAKIKESDTAIETFSKPRVLIEA